MSKREPRESRRVLRRAAWVTAQKHDRFIVAAQVRSILRAVVPISLLLVWGGCMLVRLFLQDRVPGVPAYVYYASPPIVLAGLTFVAGLWWLIGRQYKAAVPPFALALVCLVWTYHVTWYDNAPQPPADDSLRVLYWNVCWGSRGWDNVRDEIRRHRPDIVGLVEARRHIRTSRLKRDAVLARYTAAATEMQAYWQEHLPDFHATILATGLGLLTKRDVVAVREGTLGSNHNTTFGYYLDAEIRVDEHNIHVIVIDIRSTIGVSRADALHELYELLATLDFDAVIVGGDFNTPLDSVYLRPLSRRYANAFELAGRGYAATWPVPLPVLTIDHVWFNEGVRVSRCELGWSLASDHRPILLELSLPPAEALPTATPATGGSEVSNQAESASEALTPARPEHANVQLHRVPGPASPPCEPPLDGGLPG